VAVEWTITIEGRDEFGDVHRKEIRIVKSRERLFDGEVGLSIEDGKKIIAALQNAVVNHKAEAYALFSRVCPDCHTFRPVKDYTTRRIGTVYGTVEVRNPGWMPRGRCSSPLSMWAPPILSIKVGDFLRRQALRRIIEGVTGAVLIGLGLRVAAEQR